MIHDYRRDAIFLGVLVILCFLKYIPGLDNMVLDIVPLIVLYLALVAFRLHKIVGEMRSLQNQLTGRTTDTAQVNTVV